MNNYEQLQNTLKEVFEIDKADLDFGIYRIMNQKREQVMDFIDNRLPMEIKEILASAQSKDGVALQAELDKTGRALDEAGVVRESSPKYITLQQQIANSIDTNALEQEVFSHLAGFFKRYYKEGDFISIRRFKKDVYAIPYEGEEVKLHWANHDQYYIKTSEYLKNYSFKLKDGKTVHFRLKEATTEQNNNKTQGDTERRFAIYSQQPMEVENDELFINFSYELHKKTVKQSDLAAEAVQTVQQNLPGEFAAIFDKVPTETNKNRTVLDKHLNDFISRNSFDFFIHKDLGAFLLRELDFYIKNEVLFIDDINTENPAFFTAQISKIKALKTVACKVIDFLTQVEDFQKKLWLKKKFVTSTNYLITLDRISEKYYEEIAANDAQLVEWKSLFGVDVKNADLKEQPFLVVDTKFYSEEFKECLLAEFDDLDAETDGLLLNSENFQALSLIQEKYMEQVDGIYIDPPYNTAASEIIYKNEYRNSSWIQLMADRVFAGYSLLSKKGVQCTTIDDAQVTELSMLLRDIFIDGVNAGIVPILINPSGRPVDKGFALCHEYGLFYRKTQEAAISKIPRSEKQLARFNEEDKDGIFEFRNLRREGSNSDRVDGERQFFAIFGDVQSGKIRIPNSEWVEAKREWTILEKPLEYETEIFPINDDGLEKNWRWSIDSIKEDYSQFLCRIPKYGTPQVYYKYRPNLEGITPMSLWTDSKFSATEQGTKLLKDLFKQPQFSYPKSIYAVKETLSVIGAKKHTTILDYFAGSGTTGHAVIKLNRDDDGKRKYMLVEMGTYFGTVTKPRISKVIYTDNWKGGLPQDTKGISQIVKYQSLESYEDVLNNLVLKRKSATNLFTETAKEQYQLKYMLDLESREHLFDIDIFRNPFSYTLNITQNNEQVPTVVDLVETFNYLIGLYVQRQQRVKDDKRDIKLVEGKTREGKKTLVIWRNLELTTNDETQKVFRKIYDGIRSAEFDQIFINGDHHFENLRTGEDNFKIKLIEEVFFKKMFGG